MSELQKCPVSGAQWDWQKGLNVRSGVLRVDLDGTSAQLAITSKGDPSADRVTTHYPGFLQDNSSVLRSFKEMPGNSRERLMSVALFGEGSCIPKSLPLDPRHLVDLSYPAVKVSSAKKRTISGNSMGALVALSAVLKWYQETGQSADLIADEPMTWNVLNEVQPTLWEVLAKIQGNKGLLTIASSSFFLSPVADDVAETFYGYNDDAHDTRYHPSVGENRHFRQNFFRGAPAEGMISPFQYLVGVASNIGTWETYLKKTFPDSMVLGKDGKIVGIRLPPGTSARVAHAIGSDVFSGAVADSFYDTLIVSCNQYRCGEKKLVSVVGPHVEGEVSPRILDAMGQIKTLGRELRKPAEGSAQK